MGNPFNVVETANIVVEAIVVRRYVCGTKFFQKRRKKA